MSANKTEEILIRNMTFFVCVCVCGYLKKLNDSFLGGYLKRFKQLGEGIWFQTVDKQVCGKRNLAS